MKTEKQKEGKTQVQWKAWTYAQYAGERKKERKKDILTSSKANIGP